MGQGQRGLWDTINLPATSCWLSADLANTMSGFPRNRECASAILQSLWSAGKSPPCVSVQINASIVQGLIKACGEACPKALLNIISNPVNSTVPIAAETLKSMGVYDPKRLFGVTTLDLVSRLISAWCMPILCPAQHPDHRGKMASPRNALSALPFLAS